ncbi:MAG: hypothetical protein ACJ76Y_00330 [Thermoanaerobaculia bacterium]
MRTREAFGVAGTLVAMFSQPLLACVVCGSEGQCFEQPSTLSGNCECSVKERAGALVCTPKGVCDQNDPTSCTSHSPGILVAVKQAPVIDSRFLKIVETKVPFLAGAVWGAVEEETTADGAVVRTHLTPGEHTGTMGTRDHRSYTYHVFVRQLSEKVFTLFVRLEEEGTGEIQEFDGALYEGGAQGELARLENGRGVPVVVWDFRPSHQRDRGTSNPQ